MHARQNGINKTPRFQGGLHRGANSPKMASELDAESGGEEGASSDRAGCLRLSMGGLFPRT